MLSPGGLEEDCDSVFESSRSMSSRRISNETSLKPPASRNERWATSSINSPPEISYSRQRYNRGDNERNIPVVSGLPPINDHRGITTYQRRVSFLDPADHENHYHKPPFESPVRDKNLPQTPASVYSSRRSSLKSKLSSKDEDERSSSKRRTHLPPIGHANESDVAKSFRNLETGPVPSSVDSQESSSMEGGCNLQQSEETKCVSLAHLQNSSSSESVQKTSSYSIQRETKDMPEYLSTPEENKNKV